MATDLLKAVKGLQIKYRDEKDDDFSIDEMLTEPRPRKRPKRAPQALKKELEEAFLTPPTSFSSEWLNKLQQ
jgi:antiviral helicase SKI2